MVRFIWFSCLSLLLLTAAWVPAFASDWTQPTPEQLKMTRDPAAPNAPAVFLYWNEEVDDEHHFLSVYAEIKILTEKGREEFSNVAIQLSQTSWNPYYLPGGEQITGVEGRTIEPDGTVVPFTGKPFKRDVVVAHGWKVTETAFAMPDVQVGSILEYRWELTYGEYSMIPPDWILQQPIFVHKAHYHYVPTGTAINYISSRDVLGHETTDYRMLYYRWLPKHAKVAMTRNSNGDMSSYDLTVENVPPVPDEDYTPSLGSFAYRVAFYFSSAGTEADFWKQEGGFWSKDVDRFAEPSDKMKAAVAQIVAPGDTDEQKLEKIYAAAMTVENTDFTREHSQAENKAEGLRTKTAADIWTDKRGTGNQIALLFLSMARAAGLKAYAMATTDRSEAIMNPAILNWGQLTDDIAIVNAGGQDMYFDPGERYCEFGKLAWEHTQMLGIRQTDNGTEQVMTPPGSYTDNETFSAANLTLGADGKVQGQIQVTMKGMEALRWRQRALRGDMVATNKAFEKEMQASVPDGVQVKMDGFDGLTDYATNLVATLDVSGTMGTTTGKMLIVPAEFFEANVKPPFAAQTRQNPIDMRYPFAQQDQVTVTLGPGLSVESAPQGAVIPMAKGGEYKTVYSQTAAGYSAVRLLALGNTIFTQKDYPMLRGFFQGAAAQDQEQVVLRRAK